MAAYAMAKEAIGGLTKSTAIEWGKYGIRVNLVCPAAWSPGRAKLPRRRSRPLGTNPAQYPVAPLRRSVHAIGGEKYWALLPEITIASDDAYCQMPLVPGLGFAGGETMMSVLEHTDDAQRLRAQMRSQGRSPRSQAADSD